MYCFVLDRCFQLQEEGGGTTYCLIHFKNFIMGNNTRVHEIKGPSYPNTAQSVSATNKKIPYFDFVISTAMGNKVCSTLIELGTLITLFYQCQPRIAHESR